LEAVKMKTEYKYINPDVFGFRLRVAMTKRKMTGVKIAKELELQESTICNWKSGYCLPLFDTVIALADILDVSLDFLTGRSDIMEIGGVNRA
jgi:transcriptional regulator with XRE-family HTH domain